MSYWLDSRRSAGPFLNLLPSYATEEEFPWQRYLQTGGGAQWYPFAKDNPTQENRYLRAVRVFALGTHRSYYDGSSKFRPQTNHDLQIGLDYYYDNLFTTSGGGITVSAWTNAGYRHTNFAFSGYRSFLWTGNIKVRPKLPVAKGFVIPYVLADWTYVPQRGERFWENYLRLGGGGRWYPKTDAATNSVFTNGLINRFFIFFEVQHNVAWLGDHPGRSVKDTDFRAGMGFSTCGFFREGNAC